MRACTSLYCSIVSSLSVGFRYRYAFYFYLAVPDDAYSVLNIFPEVLRLSFSTFAVAERSVIRLWAEIEIDKWPDPIVLAYWARRLCTHGFIGGFYRV